MKVRDTIVDLLSTKSHSKPSRIYDWVMLMAIVIGIIPLMFRSHTKLFWYLDLISGLCFIVDYVLRWAVADRRSRHGRLMGFLTYPFTPMAIIDLLSILPTLNLIAPAFKLMRVSRLLKLLRIIKFIRYYEPLEIILAVIRRQGRILWTVCSLALFYIFITALIMFNAEEDINPETGEYLFRNFFDAFYWAACTLTTVGYGDLYPISNIGRAISIMSSIVGIAIIALPSGIVTAGYMAELENRRKNRNDEKEEEEKGE